MLQPSQQQPTSGPEQPAFPHTEININDNGVVIMIVLAPGTQITQIIPEQSMNQICAKWLESRKSVKQKAEIIRHVQSTKIN